MQNQESQCVFADAIHERAAFGDSYHTPDLQTDLHNSSGNFCSVQVRKNHLKPLERGVILNHAQSKVIIQRTDINFEGLPGVHGGRGLFIM